MRVARVAGIVLHLATGFLYLASPLVAPLGGVAVLWAGWVALLVLAIRLRAARPWWTLLVPVASIGFWALVLTVGSHLFGWTA